MLEGDRWAGTLVTKKWPVSKIKNSRLAGIGRLRTIVVTPEKPLVKGQLIEAQPGAAFFQFTQQQALEVLERLRNGNELGEAARWHCDTSQVESEKVVYQQSRCDESNRYRH